MSDLHFLPIWIVEFSDIFGAMSYQIRVVVQDGEATVSTSGEVPGGEFEISGHEDDSTRNLSVARRLPDGRYAESAGHTHYKEHG